MYLKIGHFRLKIKEKEKKSNPRDLTLGRTIKKKSNKIEMVPFGNPLTSF